MSDKDLEALSALMDGEASELEVRRVLNNIEKDQALCQTWARSQLAGSVLRGETRGAASQWQSLDISARVALAIDDEQPLQMQPAAVKNRTASAWARPFANVAVAASVSAAVILGWQGWQGQSQTAAGPVPLVASSQGGAAVLPLPSAGPTSGLMTVSQGSGFSRAAPVTPQQEIIRYNPEVDDQFNEYLISHSSNAAINTASSVAPYARVVALKPARAAAQGESPLRGEK